MASLSGAARDMYYREIDRAREADRPDARWQHLERAHILSQPAPWLHTRNHLAMLSLALRQHDRREALGQVVRIILAAPGSLTGRFPEGNTGRAAVGIMTPMPLPTDLLAVLRSAA